MADEEKTTTKSSTTTSTKKTISSKVYVSVYWYKNKPVSVIGIANPETSVRHYISKKEIDEKGWFDALRELQAKNYFNKFFKDRLMDDIIDDSIRVVEIPTCPAKELPSIAELKHEVVETKVEF